jgi:hypothetical protein
VPTKTVLKVGFLERDFERDHLAEKSNWTKMGQKLHCALCCSSARQSHAFDEGIVAWRVISKQILLRL